MAKCRWCMKDMTDDSVVTCIGNGVMAGEIQVKGVRYDPVPYDGPGERCHDCNIARGGLHHPGCDMERCPACGGQLISCGCLPD